MLSRNLPRPVLSLICETGGRLACRRTPDQREQVERNLHRVCGPGLEGRALRRSTRKVFVNYARYWSMSLRLPALSRQRIAAGHDVSGYEHVQAARAAGKGVILALPHLGGWEWSAFWLTQVEGVPVTAVVEPLQPPELFEFLVEFRKSLGINIVPLGPDAARAVLGALKRNEIVCLLSDRDLTGTGIEVEFFGEKTRLPAGPAALALRSGAPVLPTAVYFHADGVKGVVMGPLDTTRHGPLRADVTRVTADLAAAFETLIEAAPEQWHLLQPNWPSDPGYGAAVLKARRDVADQTAATAAATAAEAATVPVATAPDPQPADRSG